MYVPSGTRNDGLSLVALSEIFIQSLAHEKIREAARGVEFKDYIKPSNAPTCVPTSERSPTLAHKRLTHVVIIRDAHVPEAVP